MLTAGQMEVPVRLFALKKKKKSYIFKICKDALHFICALTINANRMRLNFCHLGLYELERETVYLCLTDIKNI